jgi:MSHA biogenesis protein MshN
MSLINQMLQDLDARGSQTGEAMQPSVKPVVRAGRHTPMLMGALAVLLVLAAVFGWRQYQSPAPLAADARPVPILRAKPAPVAAAPAPVALPVAEPEPAPAEQAPPAKAHTEKPVVKARPAAERKAATAAEAAPRKAAPPGRQMSAQQQAESDYRRALASLQDGRMADAVAALEQALQADPRHDAARQTLVGLLIEAKRTDDAIAQLRLGLAIEPRQPPMAMLLARLQIERGDSGIDSLMRTLPYAEGNSEYHAFLAGALQRQQRHREAAEQYQAALRGAPHNAVWLMGMGISLQAEKRSAEALDAFQKSKAAGSLSPELQAFVDRKLQQLSH